MANFSLFSVALKIYYGYFMHLLFKLSCVYNEISYLKCISCSTLKPESYLKSDKTINIYIHQLPFFNGQDRTK